VQNIGLYFKQPKRLWVWVLTGTELVQLGPLLPQMYINAGEIQIWAAERKAVPFNMLLSSLIVSV